MVGVVHDVEADGGNGERKHKAKREVDERRKAAQQQQQIGCQPPTEGNGGLDRHARRIALWNAMFA